jgi:C4-dicarboxylate transporter, DctM subunit
MGLNLFVIQGISKKSLNEVLAGVIPFYWLMMVMLLIMSVFPGLVVWLPGILYH